ncbi:hypothetical protein EAF04_000962 [Stromatinia cepivora]|nr:hypothetical protein EAF04_000962 [Stromatinia cepivora]
MSLAGLPNELLDKVISHTLPEGFEGLALTCKKFYALCTPFIKNHNKLRSRFRNFNYFDEFKDPRGAVSIKTAWDLIIRIAIEPVVARYIRTADFKIDSIRVRTRPRHFLSDILDPQRGEAVIRLLRDSPHLQQAGIGWEAFHADIEEKLQFTLPSDWKADVATYKLLHTIVEEATQQHRPWDRLSLAQVTNFSISGSRGPCDGVDLQSLAPFLSLPHVQSFLAYHYTVTGDALLNIESRDLFCNYRQNLEVVHLMCCHIDDAALADFLKHTPRLKALEYSHKTKKGIGLPDWDICKFVTTIGREAGNHLEQLSISIHELHGSLPLGKVSMHGFQRLRTLELPLEIVTCDIRFASSMDQTTEYSQPFINDLIPASVSQLPLTSEGKDPHQKALNLLFQNFTASKNLQLLALREIHVSCSSVADDTYKEQCTKLSLELQEAEMVFRLEPSSILYFIPWNVELT